MGYAFKIQWCKRVEYEREEKPLALPGNVDGKVEVKAEPEIAAAAPAVAAEPENAPAAGDNGGVQPMDVEVKEEQVVDGVEGGDEDEDYEDEDPREFIINVGSDTVLSQCVFHV